MCWFFTALFRNWEEKRGPFDYEALRQKAFSEIKTYTVKKTTNGGNPSQKQKKSDVMGGQRVSPYRGPATKDAWVFRGSGGIFRSPLTRFLGFFYSLSDGSVGAHFNDATAAKHSSVCGAGLRRWPEEDQDLHDDARRARRPRVLSTLRGEKSPSRCPRRPPRPSTPRNAPRRILPGRGVVQRTV